MRSNRDAPTSHRPHCWCFEHPGPCWARQQSVGFDWELRSAASPSGALGSLTAGGREQGLDCRPPARFIWPPTPHPNITSEIT
jgi:hypothetical protein